MKTPFFFLTFLGCAALLICCKDSGDNVSGDVITEDRVAPTVLTSTITITDLGNGSVLLSWDQASDNFTRQDQLKYGVYHSFNDDISTISNILTNGSLQDEYMAGMTTKTINGLSLATPHYFNVLVQDKAGNQTIYVTVSITL